jgi:hypothetical protein
MNAVASSAHSARPNRLAVFYKDNKQMTTASCNGLKNAGKSPIRWLFDLPIIFRIQNLAAILTRALKAQNSTMQL